MSNIDSSKLDGIQTPNVPNPLRHNPQANHPLLPGPVTLTREIIEHRINSFNREHIRILANEKSHGGASHVYQINVVRASSEHASTAPIEAAVIKFQMGPVQEVGFNGISDEALIAIVIDRVKGFQQGSVPCRQNALAITKLEEAVHWLRDRAEERERRGVEGTRAA